MLADVVDTLPPLLLARDLAVTQDTGLEEGTPLLLLHLLAFVDTRIASGTRSIPHHVLGIWRIC